MSYLKKICEQIIRRYEGGHPNQDNSLKYGEVKVLVCQTINRLFKAETFSNRYTFGERVPPHASLMTYTVDVGASDELIIEVTCETWPGLNLADFWATPDGSFWETDESGDYWLFDVTDSVINVTSSATGVYTVQISGLAFDTGYDADDLVTWISGCLSGSYISLVGVGETSPSKFAAAGITSLAALEGGDGISFTYTIANSQGFAGDVLTEINESHTRLANLAGEGDTAISIANFRCCTPSTNTDNRQAQITLPAQPIELPLSMGIWRIYDPKTRFTSYIPLSAGEFDLVNSVSHTNLNNILDGQTAYEWFDHKTVVFNKTITAMPDQVAIQLVVTDVDQLGDYDLLPIPADYEATVIQEVLQLLQPVQAEDMVADQNDTR